MDKLTKKVSQKPEVNMLIVALLTPEKRLEMRLVHRSFRDQHVPNAERNHPLSYSIQMGKAKRSVRKTSAVKLAYNRIKKIQGLDKASIYLKTINLGYNKILTIEGLNKCKNLVELYLFKNKIQKIPEGAFDGLVNLKLLYLSKN